MPASLIKPCMRFSRTRLPMFLMPRHAPSASHWSNQFPRLCSNNGDFNAWLNRSLQDLALLHTEGEHGAYLYAGIPWFATIFGRDGLITALETLAFAPDLAAGTLRTLAALQGQRHDPERGGAR